MFFMIRIFFILCVSVLLSVSLRAQKTYCNPLNLDYGFTPIPNFSEWGRHRATADPVIVNFKGDYYLFSTNQWGYWWSSDLNNWNFVPRLFLKPWHKVYDELCAPAAWAMGDTLFVIGSRAPETRGFPIWMSTDPRKDEWKEAIDSFAIAAWDPAFFLDDDNRLYCYWGSSNLYPLYAQELHRKTFQPIGNKAEVFKLEDERYGWQRFGEYNDNTFLDPFVEGAWVDKHNGKYYLQYGAPGTEFSGYADGVVVGEKPLGPFKAQSHNPFSYKPGGFIRGSGHGASFQDNWKNWWHVSSMVVNVKNSFERRLGLWPTAFDRDGVMYTNTTFGDYPHYLPDGVADHSKSRFTGWMLLNYNKPVQVSSTLGGYAANYAVDEDVKTYWSALNGNRGEWIQSDLGEISTVRALQVNYADQDAGILGKAENIYHQYMISYSTDGKKWKVLVDRSNNKTDVPHDYVQLKDPVEARYIRLENIHMAAGKFAISGLRVFGSGKGEKPEAVKQLLVLGSDKDRRSAWIKWSPVSDAYAYNIYFGVSPDKLYGSIMVYGSNEYYFKGMDKERSYYFAIEAINENGVSGKTAASFVKEKFD
jgi:xylan 1,4-beta-xylosidase